MIDVKPVAGKADRLGSRRRWRGHVGEQIVENAAPRPVTRWNRRRPWRWVRPPRSARRTARAAARRTARVAGSDLDGIVGHVVVQQAVPGLDGTAVPALGRRVQRVPDVDAQNLGVALVAREHLGGGGPLRIGGAARRIRLVPVDRVLDVFVVIGEVVVTGAPRRGERLPFVRPVVELGLRRYCGGPSPNPRRNNAATTPNSATNAGKSRDCDIAAENGSCRNGGSW